MPAPIVDGYNATSMMLEWGLPDNPNGPPPSYIARRLNVVFSHPSPDVERGTRFPGGGYYFFPPDIMPQGVAFSGGYHF